MAPTTILDPTPAIHANQPRCGRSTNTRINPGAGGPILSRAQEILVPLALAVVIAFALNPSVRRLERVVGRALGIALVLVVALTAVSGFGYLLKRQVEDLSMQMTRYSDSMRKKVSALRGVGKSGLTALSSGQESADAMLREGATSVDFTLEEARTKAAQLLSVAPTSADRGAAP